MKDLPLPAGIVFKNDFIGYSQTPQSSWKSVKSRGKSVNLCADSDFAELTKQAVLSHSLRTVRAWCMRPRTVSWISSAPGRISTRTCATTSLISSSGVFPFPGVFVTAVDSFSLKFVSVANVAPQRLPLGPVRLMIGVVLSGLLAVTFSAVFIGFHFLDLAVATVIASSSASAAGGDALNNSFLALAMALVRLSVFDPKSGSLGSDFVLLSASVVCFVRMLLVLEASSFVGSVIFIDDVPSGLGALSVRWGVEAAEAWALSAGFSIRDFLFGLQPLNAKGRRQLSVAGGGGSCGMVPLGQRPKQRGGVGALCVLLLVEIQKIGGALATGAIVLAVGVGVFT